MSVQCLATPGCENITRYKRKPLQFFDKQTHAIAKMNRSIASAAELSL